MVQENWISTYKRMKLGPYVTSYANINQTWVKELNFNYKTLKVKIQKKTFMTLNLAMISWI